MELESESPPRRWGEVLKPATVRGLARRHTDREDQAALGAA